MATVNEQITDSVTQVNTKTLGDVPAMAMGNMFTATSQALGNAGLNSVSAQQQASITMQAATVQGVNSLGAIGSAVLGRSSEAVID